MRFGSAASGIEAASVAWKPLGLEPAWYSEIDPFCCSLLRERHGTTPNLGDMNDITTHALRKCGRIDILVAGTPCQAFSVAGQRKGLSDPRGHLALRLLDILDWTRPRWLVWENVPGVLSSGKGFDFATFLGTLAVRGYGFAWRVFDAQFSGVPQRRRRVFLVGHLGGWRSAAEVLFESESVPGDSAPSREAKQNIAGTITAGSGRRRGAGVNPSEIVPSNVYAIQEGATKENINIGPQGMGIQERIAYTLEARHHVQAIAYQCHGSNVGPMATLRAGNGNETGGVPFTVASLTTRPYADNESHEDKLVPVAYRTTGNCGAWETGDKVDTLTTGTDQCSHILSVRRAVRRLTPRECERLMGLPNDYTLITHRGKPAADGPRYKAIGNSIAIPDLRWIGQRILNYQQ